MHAQQKPTILEAFEQFLGSSGERYQQQDMGRIISRLRRFLQKEENRNLDLSSLYCLDEYVLASQGDKQRSADLVLRFYDYLEARHGFSFDSELRDVNLIDNPTERQIEMVKYLHEPRSRAEVARHFGLEPRTIRKDLQQLAQGTEFLGVELKTEFSGRDLRYRSSLHPVFLVMDLAQAYAATVGLLKLMEPGSEQHAFYERLAANIFAQLSDYARGKLAEQAPEEAARLSALGQDMRPEWEAVMKNKANQLNYLTKSNQPATISIYRQGEERRFYRARLEWLSRDEYRLHPEKGSALRIRERDLLAIEDLEYR